MKNIKNILMKHVGVSCNLDDVMFVPYYEDGGYLDILINGAVKFINDNMAGLS
jgi:hypothetical protein